jgi:choline dehydrogenase-like flavoprotein
VPELTDLQHATVRAVCDTVVPSIRRDDDPDGFWARKATDVGADVALVEMLDTLPPDQSEGLLQLLDALAEQGFNDMSQLSREQLFANVSLASRDAAVGVGALVSLTLFLTYGLPDPTTGQNPSWKTFGFPGPISPVPDEPKTISPIVPSGDTTVEADVAIIGSGAGGGVIAGRLAERGLKVAVIEMGGYFNEADFNQSELWAYQNLYWRGGPQRTADLNIALMAGSCLGGGTVVNWTNSLRTKDWVRQEWAEHGLTDVATEAFDAHLDGVWERLKVTDACSDLNRGHQAMKRAAEKLGWSFATIYRNWDAERYDPAQAGYMGFGDQSGAKQSTLKTYLADAASRGGEVIVRCFAERVLVEGGRAAGVEGTYTDPESGETARVTVRAPQVVVAAGSLESPAVLLRSGIGGPAVGKYLRLHPATVTLGDYGQDMEAWWGAPQAGLINEFANIEDGHGFLLEGVQYTTGLAASSTPWSSGATHKEMLSAYRDGASFVAVNRDRGHGQVTIDEQGQAVPWYSITDELDLRILAKSVEVGIRAHAEAGARRIWMFAQRPIEWRVGDDLDTFIAKAQRIPARAGGLTVFSAHQMGSCRMGSDPQTSVADPSGQLHDTPGVWIGDASAFPTASGTNPMISIMALASRTADNIAEAARAAAVSSLTEVTA